MVTMPVLGPPRKCLGGWTDLFFPVQASPKQQDKLSGAMVIIWPFSPLPLCVGLFT